MREASNILHYRIVSKIGEGGMGAVYLAEDALLGRKVALKILSDEFEENEDLLRRFRQEARAASALNHPNIVTIYQIEKWNERHFISMEFVEGTNLRSALKKGRMKPGKALDIIIQAASALDAAHEAGILHRDIKPENIMIRPDGLVKILDFGLAKQTVARIDPNISVSEATTQEKFSTMPGMAMGTPAYMSPEQARGLPTDARTDVWSLGVVLYEILTGHVPFEGETKSDMLAAILTSEPPPLAEYAPDIPAELQFVVKKALGKDRGGRYQTIGEFLLDLKILKTELSGAQSVITSGSSRITGNAEARTRLAAFRRTQGYEQSARRRWLAVPLLVMLGILAVWFAARRITPADAGPPATMSAVQLTNWKSEPGATITGRARFSPDGKLIAFVAPKDGKRSVWLKQIVGGDAFTHKQDAAEETNPVWSPDGGKIAYYSQRGGRKGIWASPALGGAPVLLAATDAEAIPIHWSKDGALIYFESRQNLYVLDLRSQQISKLTNFDESKPVGRGFSFSPDGERIAYAARIDGRRDIWIADKNGANPARLTDDEADDDNPVWHPDGQRIIYNSNRGGVRQICQAFADARTPVQLTFSDNDSDVTDVSPDGSRILYTTAKDESDLWSVGLSGGKEFQITSDVAVEFWQDVAPDGANIAYQTASDSGVGSKLLNSRLLAQKIGGGDRRLELAGNGFSPRWSPDASRLAFLRSEAGNVSLWVVSATAGDARRVTDGGVIFGGHTLLPFNRLQTQDFQWSPDGKTLTYCARRDGISNVWQTSADGAGEKPLTDNADRNLIFFNPLLTPDGARLVWLAMANGDGGRFWSVWMMNEGKLAQIYQSEAPIGLIGWSEGGGLLVRTTANGTDLAGTPFEVGIHQIALDGSGARELHRLKDAYFQNVRISPDGRTLVFLAKHEGGSAIRALPLAGGAARTLVADKDPRVFFSAISFSPDGKTVYYGKQANWRIVSMIENFK